LAQRLGYLPADAVYRVQGGHGFLKNHSNPVAADPTAAGFIQAQ
jgi:hypothetical protein